MNVDQQQQITNSKAIHTVVFTVCACALLGILTEAACVIFKIPDMNNTLSGAFMHVVDTLFGALIGMLVRTTPNHSTPENPTLPPEVKITNQPDQPVPVTEKETKP